MKPQAKIVIIGRPNVGKSTLFNRLFGRRRALVHDMPGVTRDRLEEEATWWVRGLRFDMGLVDTGGLGEGNWSQEIAEQVQLALGEADLALVVFDGQQGYTSQDEDVITKLRQGGVESKMPVIGIVNKVDADVHETMITEFYGSGIAEILTISAEHGRGIQDLQEKIVDTLKLVGAKAEEVESQEPEAMSQETEDESLESEDSVDSEFVVEGEGEIIDEDYVAPELREPIRAEEKIPRIAIVGRPNVGKSTLVNALLGEKRMITSPIAGTTVDAVDSVAELSGLPVVLIDTAGVRRKSKTEQGVEVLSVVQTKKALERANIAVLVLDGETGTTDQDEKIGSLIEEAGCGVVLAINKWDTQSKNPDFKRDMAADYIRKKIAYLRYAPIVFMSAKKGQGIDNLGELFAEILKQRLLRVSTRDLTQWAKRSAEIHNPMAAKFYLTHQAGKNPPTFVFHVNDPNRVHFSLRRHFMNSLRERWGYMGNPVRMHFIEAKSRKGPRRKTQPGTSKKSSDE